MVKCDMGKCEINGQLGTAVCEVCCLMAAVNELIDKHLEKGNMRSMVKSMILETAQSIQEGPVNVKLITSDEIAQVLAEGKENGEV